MSAQLEPCPVHGCAGTKKRGQLMCRCCWFAIPVRLRRDVNRTWRAFNGKPAGDPERRDLYRRYLSSRESAINAAGEAIRDATGVQGGHNV